MARVNRAFMHRSTRWLAENGVRQFLDIGTGIPTEPNLHQIAQSVAPDVAASSTATTTPSCWPTRRPCCAVRRRGAPNTSQADVRDPHADHRGRPKILDFDRPVALSLIALLHFVSDEDGAHALVGRLMSELPSGSYLVVTHATADFTPEESKAATEKLKAAGVTLALRSREEFTRFFDGLELVDPGVEVPHHWHPELGEPIPGQDDGVIPGYGAVARKP